jgi:hypothetical protein
VIVLLVKVTKKILGGTALIVVGCILLVSFGNHDSKVLTVHDMIADFKRWAQISCSFSFLGHLHVAHMHSRPSVRGARLYSGRS